MPTPCAAFGRPDLLELIRDTCPKDFALLPPHTRAAAPFISLLAGHQELERPDWTAAELIKAQAPDKPPLPPAKRPAPPVLTRCFLCVHCKK